MNFAAADPHGKLARRTSPLTCLPASARACCCCYCPPLLPSSWHADDAPSLTRRQYLALPPRHETPASSHSCKSCTGSTSSCPRSSFPPLPPYSPHSSSSLSSSRSSSSPTCGKSSSSVPSRLLLRRLVRSTTRSCKTCTAVLRLPVVVPYTASLRAAWL